MWAGRFHEQKGLFEIVDILKRVREKKKDVRLLLLGDGNKKIKKKLFEMIEKNNLNKNIDYRGFIIGKEKDKLIKKCKIFMMTSYYEGLPLTISEFKSLRTKTTFPRTSKSSIVLNLILNSSQV